MKGSTAIDFSWGADAATDGDYLALLRGLARQDADPQAVRELLQRLQSEDDPQWVRDFGAAFPNRQGMLAVLRKAFKAGEDIPYNLADALGDRDLALTVLRSYVTRNRGMTGTWWQPWMLVNSGARADPRFKELMREAGLADYWRQSGRWADFCGPVGEDDFECHCGWSEVSQETRASRRMMVSAGGWRSSEKIVN